MLIGVCLHALVPLLELKVLRAEFDRGVRDVYLDELFGFLTREGLLGAVFTEAA